MKLEDTFWVIDKHKNFEVILKNGEKISGHDPISNGTTLIFLSTYNEPAETATVIDINEISAIIGRDKV